MRVTFLEAKNGLRLSKHYSLEKLFTPYPHVKAVSSHTHDVAVDLKGLTQLEQLIRDHGALGHCMLKGDLKRDLVGESRAGHTNRTALSNLLVLDVDGVKLSKPLNTNKLSSADVMYLSNQIIGELPQELQNVSYIAQASSSLGLKGDKTSLHIFMFLKTAMPPKTIKLWLQDANFESDLFVSQLGLSVNGQSLKFPLDSSVADNSKLVFISTPSFEDATANPFANDNDRIILVTREQHSFDLGVLMQNVSPQRVYEKAQSCKDKLREDVGFRKKQIKTRLASIDSITEEVLVNPDRMSINIADNTNFPYVRCNINGGDSSAYYFNIEKPTYMYNFKDEPIFEIEKADPEFYMSVFETYAEHMQETGRAEFPVIMRDYNTDTFFNGVYDPNKEQFSEDYPLVPCNKNNVEDFFMSHGKIAPDFIPDGRVVFDPTSNDSAVNFTKVPYYVNTYTRSKYVLAPDEPATPIEFGYAKTIKDKCPLIYRVIYHMLGEGDEEFERFINWLAHIYQTRQKTKVAWVLTGTQGTGKGVFYSRILRKLFGNDHVPMRYLQNMEEQFNLYMRDALFLIVDEFHMASSSSGAGKMADKLKSQITEPTLTIRGMRANQKEIASYTNYIFLTNRVDAVNIESGDRRYNIGPRQDTKLIVKYPDMPKRLATKEIDNELYAFAGALATFKVSQRFVEQPIDNTAKEQMRNVSMSVFDEFCQAIKDGNLPYFADILEINTASVLHANEIIAAQRLVKNWIASCKDEYTVIPREHLRTVFHIQTEQMPRYSQRDFSKKLSRNGLEPQRRRAVDAGRDANTIYGLVVSWKINQEERQTLINGYFEASDERLLA